MGYGLWVMGYSFQVMGKGIRGLCESWIMNCGLRLEYSVITSIMVYIRASVLLRFMVWSKCLGFGKWRAITVLASHSFRRLASRPLISWGGLSLHLEYVIPPNIIALHTVPYLST